MGFESNSERIFKIGKHLAKLRTRLRYLVFLTHSVFVDLMNTPVDFVSTTVRYEELFYRALESRHESAESTKQNAGHILFNCRSIQSDYTEKVDEIYCCRDNEFVPVHAFSEGMVPGPGRAFSCVELMPRPPIDSAATSSHLSAAHPTAAPSCSLSSRL